MSKCRYQVMLSKEDIEYIKSLPLNTGVESLSECIRNVLKDHKSIIFYVKIDKK